MSYTASLGITRLISYISWFFPLQIEWISEIIVVTFAIISWLIAILLHNYQKQVEMIYKILHRIPFP